MIHVFTITKLRQKATFVFPFVWPPPPYPRAMGTLDHPLVGPGTCTFYRTNHRKVGDRNEGAILAGRFSRRAMQVLTADQGRLFSSYDAM